MPAPVRHGPPLWSFVGSPFATRAAWPGRLAHNKRRRFGRCSRSFAPTLHGGVCRAPMYYARSLLKGVLMRRLLLVVALALSSSSAFALQTAVPKGTKIGTGCVGPIVLVATRLQICPIAGSKTRIWCPNGE